METLQIIIVTGGNRGIGFSIVQSLGLRNPSATYILACRSLSSGTDAIAFLQKAGVKAPLDIVSLDIIDDASIIAARDYVQKTYGHLDILVNNVGVGLRPKSGELADLRDNFNATFNANITSLAARTTEGHQYLVRSSKSDSVAHGNLPPTAVVSYAISKAAVNSLTIEMQKTEDTRKRKIEFFVANPGHCKTAFNGFKRTKYPLDGAEVVTRLALGSTDSGRKEDSGNSKRVS